MDPPFGILFVSVLGETGEGVHPGIFSALIGHIPPSLDLHIYISLWYTYLGRPTTFFYL